MQARVDKIGRVTAWSAPFAALKYRQLRWFLIGWITVSTILNYIVRQTLSIVAPLLRDEFRLSNQDYSNVVNAFLISYTAMYTMGGRLVYWIGERIAMAACIIWWSLATMAHSLAQGAVSLGIFRFLLGIGEPANYPAALRAATIWFPKSERGQPIARYSSGSAVGAVLAGRSRRGRPTGCLRQAQGPRHRRGPLQSGTYQAADAAPDLLPLRRAPLCGDRDRVPGHPRQGHRAVGFRPDRGPASRSRPIPRLPLLPLPRRGSWRRDCARRDDRLGQELIRQYGFRSVKLKSGVLPPDHDIAVPRALRERLGPKVGLRVDPNGYWSRGIAFRVAKALEEVGLEYLEDPIWGLEGMARVKERTWLPLATNMCVASFEHIAPAVAMGAVDVILSDIYYWEGIRGVKALGVLCECFRWGLSMHSGTELGVTLAAMLHTAASLPNLTYDVDAHYHHLLDDVIAGGKMRDVNGEIAVPTGPGLGVELDPDRMGRYEELFENRGDYYARFHKDTRRPDWFPNNAGWRESTDATGRAGGNRNRSGRRDRPRDRHRSRVGGRSGGGQRPAAGRYRGRTVSRIQMAGGRAVAVAADVADLCAHERLVQAGLDHFGRLDILVNNAGVQFRQPFLDATPQAWDRTLDVNLKGPLLSGPEGRGGHDSRLPRRQDPERRQHP